MKIVVDGFMGHKSLKEIIMHQNIIILQNLLKKK